MKNCRLVDVSYVLTHKIKIIMKYGHLVYIYYIIYIYHFNYIRFIRNFFNLYTAHRHSLQKNIHHHEQQQDGFNCGVLVLKVIKWYEVYNEIDLLTTSILHSLRSVFWEVSQLTSPMMKRVGTNIGNSLGTWFWTMRGNIKWHVLFSIKLWFIYVIPFRHEECQAPASENWFASESVY